MWPLVLLLISAGLFALYLCQSRAAPFNSDGAANVLQGRAMVTGNPLLRGWWTSDVSFYTTELPEYALVTAIRGLSPDVVHLCGALTYTLTVLLAALAARAAGRRERGRRPAGSARASRRRSCSRRASSAAPRSSSSTRTTRAPPSLSCFSSCSSAEQAARAPAALRCRPRPARSSRSPRLATT